MSSDYVSSPYYTRRVLDFSIPSSLFSLPFNGISLLCPVRYQPSMTVARTSTAVSGAVESVASLSLSSIVVLMLLQKIECLLSNLISEIAIPPPLAKTILNTDVGKPWLVAVPEFEQKLDSLNVHACVKAFRALSEVAEGLRIIVCTVLFWRRLLSFLV